MPSMHRTAYQIVGAWFLVRTHSHHVVSLNTCRQAIDPGCSWDSIGAGLQCLINSGTVPPDLIHLKPVNTGNTTVVVGHFGTSLVVIKQHLFSRGSWEVSSSTFQEIMSADRLGHFKWYPRTAFRSITENMLQIGMEYLPMDLRQMVRLGGSRSCIFVRRVMSGLLSAASALHQAGVAHRDIKPDNIRFRSDGTLVLIDYDSCIRLVPNMHRSTNICTLGYRDPSLLDPDVDIATYDYRTLDAFSCGAVYLYALDGCRRDVFLADGTTPDKVRRYMEEYITTMLSTACKRLSTSDGQVVRGLLDLCPKTRLTVCVAARMHREDRGSFL